MNLHSDIRIWLWVIIYSWYISNFTKLFTLNKNQNFVLLLQVPCSILAPLFSLNTLVTRSGDPTPPLKSQGQDSCIYILLYNNDKEKVIRYRYRSDTATRFSILARQQNWKRFPALISRLLIFRDWSMLPYFGHFLQNLQQSSMLPRIFWCQPHIYYGPLLDVWTRGKFFLFQTVKSPRLKNPRRESEETTWTMKSRS